MEVIGWVGAALVLGAYGLISMHKVKANQISYQVMNVGGAVMLAAYAQWHGAIASVAVNVVWLAIGVIALYRIARI